MRRLYQLVVAVVICLGSASGWGQDKETPLLIDTRSPDEYAAGHAQGAILIPYDAIEAGIVKHTENKDQPIYLYCGSGGRAEIARKSLLRRGYTQVTNLGGLAEAEAFQESQP